MIKISQQDNLRVRNIQIKNFRTFYGEKEPIELSTDTKSPVTVIHGVSGRGKTTLLNAVHWCIYGTENKKLDQKRSVSEGLIHNYVIDTSKKRHITRIWDDNVFYNLYMNRCMSIYINLNKNSYIKAGSLVK